MPEIALPSVAVVILNWNGRKLLEQFLPSVLQTNYSNLQVFVGDNASTDDSVTWLKANHPQVRVIVNEKNFGFAGGYNQILEKINSDYFVLLNSDVEVPQNWISPVIQLMESNESIAAAQPKLLWQRQKNSFEYAGAAGGFIDNFGFPFCRGRIFDTLEADDGQYNDVREIFWASGACLFIKREAWLLVGGLDADLFAHMEEIDLCWRLKNMGRKIVYCPNAYVYHLGGATLNATNPRKTYLNFRNNLIIMQKNLPLAQATWRIFARLWIDFAAWWEFLLSGKPQFTLAISKAHLHFFLQIAKTAKKRASNQKPLASHSGVYTKSIVWNYFAKGVKTFKGLHLG